MRACQTTTLNGKIITGLVEAAKGNKLSEDSCDCGCRDGCKGDVGLVLSSIAARVGGLLLVDCTLTPTRTTVVTATDSTGKGAPLPESTGASALVDPPFVLPSLAGRGWMSGADRRSKGEPFAREKWRCR